MIGMRWLRRLIRRNTAPIDEDKARKWKERLSVAYMLCAWNTFGLIVYGWYKDRGDWADYYGLKTEEDKIMPNNEYFARTIGTGGTTKLIKMKGFTVVEEKDFNNETEKEKEGQGAEERPPINMEERVERRRKLIKEQVARQQKEHQDQDTFQ